MVYTGSLNLLEGDYSTDGVYSSFDTVFSTCSGGLNYLILMNWLAQKIVLEICVLEELIQRKFGTTSS